MTKILDRTDQWARLSSFRWLMGLYAENHVKLERLFAPCQRATGTYFSQGADGLILRADVLEQHRFTTEMRLTYTVEDPETGALDPSAFIRAYRDAKQVEATHCRAGRNWQDAIGMFPPPEKMIDHRLRMNIFLGKWLDYLGSQGHAAETFDASPVHEASIV